MAINNFKSVQLESIVSGLSIESVKLSLYDDAKAHLNSLTKPQGSLGRLEELAIKIYGLSGGNTPISVDPALMLTVAGDHGVVAQKVSPFPQEVTRQMVLNFLSGGAAINALCADIGIDLCIVDAGCAGGKFDEHPLLIDRRLGNGTADISKGPAMSKETCLKALRMGVELAWDAISNGYKCLGLGEMGIGNSTPASALYCAFLGLDPKDIVGPGCGADKNMINHKCSIIEQSLKVNNVKISLNDPIEVLACLGGFEIAIMSGIMLGAASKKIPVLVDGFICSAAYVAALHICNELSSYAFLSHSSAEPGHKIAMQRIEALPILQLDMRLGEGTGAAVAYQILHNATAIYNNMATMASANVTATESDRIL